MASTHSFITFILCILFLNTTIAHPHRHSDHHAHLFAHKRHPTCRAPTSPYDYSAKSRQEMQVPVCEVTDNPIKDIIARKALAARAEDYSCSQTKPCSNGACCSKKTGFCNYGADACGPNPGNNPSPNDVCWSNCNATAECGRYALPAGKTCPLNVCCSEYGFCGSTSEFCSTTGTNGGCQSNCPQPGSGGSGGNVQSRVIGYYEAWAHDRSCQTMDFNAIPAGALTHLYFSFGYITPGDFNIAPMDDLKPSLFSDITAVKARNPDLKVVVALGGWTFNDNNTATQPVFSNMVSSSANRQKFIGNLLGFMRLYAFDGVDFDWYVNTMQAAVYSHWFVDSRPWLTTSREYPGAPDRGGKPDDGKNFVTFLQELQAAIAAQPIKYVVSFTVPTSYWYLRWFDLSAVNYVDFINVMSYDLHGTWDSTNPIGNHVLAHTNLTEIKLALDLFWRNSVPPAKLNLGLGFYGRSFQLSDPSCNTPGCLFKGGAAPGPCTKNSGTLSYREITSIIDQYKLQPIYDKDNGVKYITWNQDQWVSYDDADTFKQKIDFANNLGLGGLLIWSIDQDTDDLKALSAVVAPKDLSVFKKLAQNAGVWQDATSADCYVTDCGGTCQPGFLQITHQPCGGAKAITRHSKEADSALCCPITAAPDPNKCTWRGTAPSCNGHCHDNEVALQLNRWGSGKYCEDGNKVYCCETEKPNKCYFSGGKYAQNHGAASFDTNTKAVGKDCNSGDQTLTFAGTFLESIVDILEIFPPTLFGSLLDDALTKWDMDLRKKLCCPPDEYKRWKNCAWHGTPGSCFDNHCDTGHQVQVANSKYGLGQSCFPRSERERVFCCDAADGASPFLPVPLANLFKNPPTGSGVAVDSKLKVDNTWGDGIADTPDDLPNDSTFGFVVLASPETLQVSLDRRDGSDWQVYNCNDAVSEEAQTVQMYCTNSNTTNCDKLFLGHGAVGTIIEMPDGCGPSRYAVVKSFEPAKEQVFPKHLEKRSYAHGPIIHDLTFDYEWTRVPRDLGNTQMRIDYSNEIGYWDSIVNKAGNTKRKRSLEEMGGNHKRWLEEEWRDDMHFGGLSREELHKRWFGKDVIDWLKGFFNPNIKPQYKHALKTDFTAKLIEEHFNCKIKGADVDAHLLIQALLSIDVRTSFGITIIATLGRPISFSDSYLYFKNQGEVSAIFTLDALAKATFGRDVELLNLGNFPGATFSVPNLVTVGPNFRLLGRVDAQITLAGHLESRARIAAWDVQMTYPAATDDYKPKNQAPVVVDGTGDFQGISRPTFDYSVSAQGVMSAHLKPTFEFGVHFDDRWGVPNAAVQLIADGSVTVSADVNYGNGGQCPFTYGIDVGARLYTHVDAPNFGWNIPDFDLFPLVTRSPVKSGTCASQSKRSIEAGEYHDDHDFQPYNASAWRDISTSVDTYVMEDVSVGALGSVSHLSKRAGVFGPAFQLPKTGCYFCPGQSSSGKSTDCAQVTGWEDGQLAASAANDWRLKRDESAIATIAVSLNETENEHFNFFEKRQQKDIEFCSGMHIISPAFDSSGVIVGRLPNIPTYGYTMPNVCNDFGFQALGSTPADTSKFATEHILEFQLIKIFLEELSSDPTRRPTNPSTASNAAVNLCTYLKPYWYTLPSANWPTVNGVQNQPMAFIASQFPGTGNFENEFVLLESGVNCAKEGMWGRNAINSPDTMARYSREDPEKEIRNLKDVLTAYRYHTIGDIRTILLNQRNRIGTMFQNVENALVGTTYTVRGTTYRAYQSQGLAAAWGTWSTARLEIARTKAETYMSTYLQALQEAYATPYLRDAASKANTAGDPAPSTRIAKIDALAQAIQARPAWNAPF